MRANVPHGFARDASGRSVPSATASPLMFSPGTPVDEGYSAGPAGAAAAATGQPQGVLPAKRGLGLGCAGSRARLAGDERERAQVRLPQREHSLGSRKQYSCLAVSLESQQSHVLAGGDGLTLLQLVNMGRGAVGGGGGGGTAAEGSMPHSGAHALEQSIVGHGRHDSLSDACAALMFPSAPPRPVASTTLGPSCSGPSSSNYGIRQQGHRGETVDDVQICPRNHGRVAVAYPNQFVSVHFGLITTSLHSQEKRSVGEPCKGSGRRVAWSWKDESLLAVSGSAVALCDLRRESDVVSSFCSVAEYSRTRDIAFDPHDENRVAVATDKGAYIFDLRSTGKPLFSVGANEGAAHAIDFHPTLPDVVAFGAKRADVYGAITVSNISEGCSYEIRTTDSVLRVRWRPCQRGIGNGDASSLSNNSITGGDSVLASIGVNSDTDITLWDVTNPFMPLASLKRVHGAAAAKDIRWLSVSELVSCGTDGRVCVSDVATAVVHADMVFDGGVAFAPFDEVVTCGRVAWSSDSDLADHASTGASLASGTSTAWTLAAGGVGSGAAGSAPSVGVGGASSHAALQAHHTAVLHQLHHAQRGHHGNHHGTLDSPATTVNSGRSPSSAAPTPRDVEGPANRSWRTRVVDFFAGARTGTPRSPASRGKEGGAVNSPLPLPASSLGGHGSSKLVATPVLSRQTEPFSSFVSTTNSEGSRHVPSPGDIKPAGAVFPGRRATTGTTVAPAFSLPLVGQFPRESFVSNPFPFSSVARPDFAVLSAVLQTPRTPVTVATFGTTPWGTPPFRGSAAMGVTPLSFALPAAAKPATSVLGEATWGGAGGGYDGVTMTLQCRRIHELLAHPLCQHTECTNSVNASRSAFIRLSRRLDFGFDERAAYPTEASSFLWNVATGCAGDANSGSVASGSGKPPSLTNQSTSPANSVTSGSTAPPAAGSAFPSGPAAARGTATGSAARPPAPAVRAPLSANSGVQALAELESVSSAGGGATAAATAFSALPTAVPRHALRASVFRRPESGPDNTSERTDPNALFAAALRSNAAVYATVCRNDCSLDPRAVLCDSLAALLLASDQTVPAAAAAEPGAANNNNNNGVVETMLECALDYAAEQGDAQFALSLALLAMKWARTALVAAGAVTSDSSRGGGAGRPSLLAPAACTPKASLTSRKEGDNDGASAAVPPPPPPPRGSEVAAAASAGVSFGARPPTADGGSVPVTPLCATTTPGVRSGSVVTPVGTADIEERARRNAELARALPPWHRYASRDFECRLVEWLAAFALALRGVPSLAVVAHELRCAFPCLQHFTVAESLRMGCWVPADAARCTLFVECGEPRCRTPLQPSVIPGMLPPSGSGVAAGGTGGVAALVGPDGVAVNVRQRSPTLTARVPNVPRRSSMCGPMGFGGGSDGSGFCDAAACVQPSAVCNGACRSVLYDCGVCGRPLERGQVYRVLRPCGHGGHASHITAWLAESDECPVCGVAVAAAASETVPGSEGE